MKGEPKIKTWVIIDDKTGNANQAIALAEAMELNYTVKHLKYNFLAKLPNWLKFDSLLGIDLKKSNKLSEPYPDLIISSGRKTATVSNHVKKINPKTFVVHLMHPDLPFKNFDLIALPLHDLTEKYADVATITYTVGAPSYQNPETLKTAATEFKNNLELKAPFVSLIIGGKTKSGNYTVTELENLVKKANELTKKLKGSLLITTSRRTDEIAAKSLAKHISVPHFFYNWHEKKAKNNPYLAFLGLSDYFIVTGDSVSICSEVLATGKPVYIYRKDDNLYKKHRRFLDYLEQLKFIRYINDDTASLEKWTYKPLKEAERLGKIINEKLTNERLSANNNIPSKNS